MVGRRKGQHNGATRPKLANPPEGAHQKVNCLEVGANVPERGKPHRTKRVNSRRNLAPIKDHHQKKKRRGDSKKLRGGEGKRGRK